MSDLIYSDDDSFYSSNSHNTSFVSVPSLQENLQCRFSDAPRNFNVVHINAQSIPAHFPDMLATFTCKNLHAILVSETWLKPCLPSTSYSLPGFHLIRNDRAIGGGGGVGIYLRQHIPFTIVSISSQPPPPDAGEHLFLELDINHAKILLGVYYSPSLRTNYFSSFEKLLEKLSPSYAHTIILGDFNTCLLKKDYRSSSLTKVVECNNLSLLSLDATHHFPNCTPSLLDLILVSSTKHVISHGQYPADAFSYHDLIFLSYAIRPPKAKPRILVQRNFSGMNLAKLKEDARNIDWSALLDSQCVNEKVAIFNEKLIQLYNMHAPLRSIKIKHLPAPWLTEEIKQIMAKKCSAKSKYKRRPTDANLEKYVYLRNLCNKMCRNAQRQHIHSSVENGDPAKVWKFLRTLGVGKSRENSIPKNFNIDSLNKHFSASSDISNNTKANTLRNLSSTPTPNYPSFMFDQLSVCDVKKTILAISSSAVGSDCISRNMILPILDEILIILCNILNYSITSGVFPTAWKDAQLIPLPKKSKPSSFSDYRPISILPFLSKVLERLIHSQLSSFLSKNSLLNPFQSGFRPGHSTSSALVHITDSIRLGMDSGMITVLTLLDFSNAFNTVDFHILLGILRSLNISPRTIDWFHSYLFGRRQRICIEDSMSSWCDISAGVPQGGVLSPLLFAVFINSISTQLNSHYHLYADDLQIYTQAKLNLLPEAFNTINADLRRISDWSLNHGLKVNPVKTQVCIIGSPGMISRVNWTQLPQIQFNGTNLEISTSVKNLGIYIDSTLSWGSQMQEVSRKLFASVGSLRRLRNFLPTATRAALAQALLLPVLDYADVSYLDLTEAQLDKLERLQNLCIRFVFGLRKYDHVSEFRRMLKWLPIRSRRNTHILTLLYNILFNPRAPFYLKERFKFLNDTHAKCLRSSENLRLEMPLHSTKFYNQSFTVEAIRLWNALPTNIKKAQTLTKFKKMVHEYYAS